MPSKIEMSDADLYAAFDADFTARSRDEYNSVVVLDVIADARFVIITDESQRDVRLFVISYATTNAITLYAFDALSEAFAYVAPYLTPANLDNLD